MKYLVFLRLIAMILVVSRSSFVFLAFFVSSSFVAIADTNNVIDNTEIIAKSIRPLPDGKVVTVLTRLGSVLIVEKEINRKCLTPQQPKAIRTEIEISSIGKVEVIENGPFAGVRLSGKTELSWGGFKTSVLGLIEQWTTCGGKTSTQEATISKLILVNDNIEADDLVSSISAIIQE